MSKAFDFSPSSSSSSFPSTSTSTSHPSRSTWDASNPNSNSNSNANADMQALLDVLRGKRLSSSAQSTQSQQQPQPQPQSQIPDAHALLALLAPLLDALGLLPPRFRGYLARSTSGGASGASTAGAGDDVDVDVGKDVAGEWKAAVDSFSSTSASGGTKARTRTRMTTRELRESIQRVQRVLLEDVVPTWGSELALVRLGRTADEGEDRLGGLALLDQLFCPDAFVNASRAAGEVARAAYATLGSVPGSVLVGSAAATGGGGAGAGGGGGDYALRILGRLVVEYPVDRLYTAVFPAAAGAGAGAGKAAGGGDRAVQNVDWEDCVRDACKVPVVVANALGAVPKAQRRRMEEEEDVPSVLQHAEYFDRMSARVEVLLSSLSNSGASTSPAALEPLTYLLAKLVNQGVFPAHPPTARSQPSFFRACLPAVRARLRLASSSSSSSSASAASAAAYSAMWTKLFQNVASSSGITLQSILASLFGSLFSSPSSSPSSFSSSSFSTPTPTAAKHPALSADPTTRAHIKRTAALLHFVLGPPDPERTPALWQIATSLVGSRDWPGGELHARAFVAWVSGACAPLPSSLSSSSSGAVPARVDVKGTSVVLDAFLGAVLDVWASPEHIKHSLLSRHRYTTALLLLAISYFPSSPSSSSSSSEEAPAPQVQNLVSSPPFISAVGTYIAHLDPAVRRCGMLAAEVVAHLCGRKLDFGGWDVDGGGGDSDSDRRETAESEGLEWCREMRALIRGRDVDADVTVGGEGDEEAAQEKGGEGAGVEMEMEDISTPAAAAAAARAQQTGATAAPAPARATFLPKPSDGYDSDDSLTGYASPPSTSSSRSASPTPSELAEIEKDPTLSVGVKRVPRPVYLAQLGELLRVAGGGKGTGQGGGKDDPHDADRVQMALDCAEGLIRRKRGYGTELEENAVDLVHGFLALQDNFDLDGFAEKRQAALNALVVCAPTKATPTLIQEFFKNQYSTDQRLAALNALAMGARELADLPVPPTPSTSNPARTAFPSKLLPGNLHNKYISAGDVGANAGTKSITDRADRTLLPKMVEELTTEALAEHREEAGRAAAGGTPALIRERRLRVQKPQLVSEITPSTSTPLNPFSRAEFQTPPRAAPSGSAVKFIDIAAEHFILPLISSFWAFLRDSQALEQRTAHLSGRGRYRGAGTGLILNPMVLAQLVRTLAVLVHAAHNAKEWMALVAPDALEVGVTLGTRPVSSMEEDGGDDGADADAGASAAGPDGPSKEAALLTATLELALVVLDGALELDGGRVLGLEHTALVLGVGEWAGKVFSSLERGLRVQGGGGVHEARLSRAAAGVVLKVDELMSKWRRSMIDL